MNVESTLKTKLDAAFAPDSLLIENESDRHKGHVHAGTETHFRVRIVSRAFDGKTRIERHRMVNELLADELKGPVHALAISALTPGEARGTSL